MYKIVKKGDRQYISYGYRGKRVAKSCKPGQFIIIKNDEKGEEVR